MAIIATAPGPIPPAVVEKPTFPYLLRHTRTGAVILVTGRRWVPYDPHPRPRWFAGHLYKVDDAAITGFIVVPGDTSQEIGKRWNSANSANYELFDGVVTLENE